MSKKTSYGDMTDEMLLAAAKSGQEDIMDYLMGKYKALVLKQAKTLYLIGGENDDLIQEGMIGLFKAVRDYKEEKKTSFYHFAQVCIARQMYHAIEASNRKKHAPLNESVSIDEKELMANAWGASHVQAQRGNPEHLFIEQEDLEDLRQKVMKLLSPMEQEVLLDYLAGMDYRAIAEKHDRQPKSVDNAIQRIRRKIRRQII